MMLRSIIRATGFNPRRLTAAVRGWLRYRRERRAFRVANGSTRDWPWGRELPILTEWDDAAGSLGAYFFQDQLVARWIHAAGPARHVDVGSRLDGFVGHLSIFREVDVIDIRPPPAPVFHVKFHQLDLMQPLPPEWRECTDSLSCLHTIEHFGLGRYGDPLCVDGHLKGLEQLKRMVRPGGVLYLSTPIGPQRVEFNAHRVFAVSTIIDWFADGWEIRKFAVIDDTVRLHENVDWQSNDAATHFGCHLGVGVVAAVKHPSSAPLR